MRTNKFAELHTFVMVVDACGISEAARRLGVSKAIVSRRIQLFEKRLNACLLERGHKLRVTPAGKQLYEGAIHILDELTHAEEAIKSTTAEFSGELRIVVPTVFGPRYLSPILTLFAKQYPEIHLDIEASDNVASSFDENFDIAIRISTPPDSSLICLPNFSMLSSAASISCCRRRVSGTSRAMRRPWRVITIVAPRSTSSSNCGRWVLASEACTSRGI